tara:strand:+ start:1848 stop:3848 length:2001 start_codon:yes stop_codon:yes gene_type:complete
MANPAINFAGFLYNDAGTAVSGATVNLYDKNTVANVRATTTTDSNGAWSIAHTTAGEFDIEIVSGASKRRIKFDDKVHLSELDAETINIRANEGGDAPLYFFADEGDDAGDRWQFKNAAGGVFTMGNDINSQGTYVAHVTITPNSTVASSTFAIAGNATVGGALTVTGTTTLNGNLVLGDAAADTLTIGATLQGASPLTFEGATADGNETTFAITDPTADRTITFPDAAGTVLLTGNALSGTSLTLSSVSAAGTDTDKFLVLDSSGNVDYRTGTEVLSDIGGGTGGMTSFQLEDDSGDEVTISNAKEVKIIGSGVTTNWTDTDNGTDGDPYDLTITVDAAQTGITSVYNASLKLGRDADNLVDFATTDNKIIFRVEGVDEVELVQNALSPITSDGVSLGTSSLMWSDLFVASGSVINFHNGDVTLTHSSNTLTVAGGTLATAALTASTGTFSGILKTDDTTNATSTTDGSLQTDGGLSVVLDAIFGDDVTLITDSAVLNLGVGSDVSITHDGTTGGTITGTPMVYESKGAAALANNTHAGIVLEFLAGESLAVGDWVYMSTVDGRVSKADANDTGDGGHYPAIGVAVSAQGSAGSAVKILTHGVYNDSDGFGGDLTEGNVLFLSETAGGVTATAPSDDGDMVQVCGIAVGPRDVFVNPSLDVIEHD